MLEYDGIVSVDLLFFQSPSPSNMFTLHLSKTAKELDFNVWKLSLNTLSTAIELSLLCHSISLSIITHKLYLFGCLLRHTK